MSEERDGELEGKRGRKERSLRRKRGNGGDMAEIERSCHNSQRNAQIQ